MQEIQKRLPEVFGMMRDYQKEALKRLVLNKKHLNYMPMGMGKSLVSMTAVINLAAFPCIIVCPKSAMGVWKAELQRWYGAEATLYVGKVKERQAAWKQFVTKGHKFIITNYALIKELAGLFGVRFKTSEKGSRTSGTKSPATQPHPGTKPDLKIGAVIADEIQLAGLFNHKTVTYGVFATLTKHVDVMYLLSGTPMRRGVIDFYGPLSIVAPKEFDSYWKYISKWCVKINTGFGVSVERTPKDIIAFRVMIREYAIIMRKEDYLHELPGKMRQPIPISMDAEQRKVYEELTENLFSFVDGQDTDDGDIVIAPNILTLTVKQRQLLVCPQELGLKTRGAAIDTLMEMTESLAEENKPFVVFTPFKAGVRWISRALQETYPDMSIYSITGELTPEEFSATWQGFQNDRSRQGKALICVIRSGVSFHATVADTCFFLGYEWDFNQNEQAEDRLNRMGQKNMVTCYYFMHDGTIDEEVAQRLNDKKYSSNLILSNWEFVKALLRLKET